jgi:hypothetical protein
MKLRIACVVGALLSLALSLTQLVVAQTSATSAQTAAQTASALPRLVRFGGAVKDINGNPLTGVVGITFALYSERTATGGNGDPYGYDGNSHGGNGVVGVGGRGIGSNGMGFDGDGVGGVFTGGNTGGNDTGDGVDVYAGSGFAGYFGGNVEITGTLNGSTPAVKVDDPLDPANKYLLHAPVQSSEMMNIYSGNITTDSQGQAMVQLPEWFEVLNTDFRYQLTVIGQFAQAVIGHKIENNQFEVRTSTPNVEVSWQVTGVRQDAYAKAHPLVVEQEKDLRVRGFYIHPELYGAPAEKQIEWGRHPEMMRQIKAMQAKQLAAPQKAGVPRLTSPKE